MMSPSFLVFPKPILTSRFLGLDINFSKDAFVEASSQNRDEILPLVFLLYLWVILASTGQKSYFLS